MDQRIFAGPLSRRASFNGSLPFLFTAFPIKADQVKSQVRLPGLVAGFNAVAGVGRDEDVVVHDDRSGGATAGQAGFPNRVRFVVPMSRDHGAGAIALPVLTPELAPGVNDLQGQCFRLLQTFV